MNEEKTVNRSATFPRVILIEASKTVYSKE